MYTKVVGLGFGGVPALAELAAIEEAYAAHGATVRLVLFAATFAPV